MRDTQRLDKILGNFGYGTRKEIKQAVKNGVIKVDGIAVKDSSMHVDPKCSVIEINGEILNYREFVYVMMNKPDGVVSATYDNKLRTVIDILPEEFRCFELFPVGRLDIDTEGLLILTNDGQLAHELLSPKKHVSKKYYALIEGKVTEEDVSAFKGGVILDDGYKTLPGNLTILKPDQFSEIELVIYEGKFHQVKRMFEAVGKRVKYLKRIEMGRLKLDEEIAAGKCRELTSEEIIILKESVKVSEN
ncbi:MAG: rRNA pseudouridine synthase [Clostridia bacterium]|nr:rRNA pseudouridine synthase [Clostridia bacterium]